MSGPRYPARYRVNTRVRPGTLQLDYGNPDLRPAMIGELTGIAGRGDGVRGDIAGELRA